MIDLVEAPSVMGISEYIGYLPKDSANPIIAARLLEDVKKSIELYNKIHGFTDFPELRITSDQLPNAEGIQGMIRISHGMIYHCATTEILGFYDIANIANLMKIVRDFTWSRSLMLSWVALHEYMHGIRQHEASLAELGQDSGTQMAIEYDADLCAIAGVYRVAQNLRQFGLSDMDVRKVVLGSVFWCLRTLTTFCKRTTHSSVADRMVQMITKLATLLERAAPGQMADNSFVEPESHARIDELVTALAHLEKEFQKSPYYRQEYGHLTKQVLETLEQGHWLTASERWNEIRMQVAERLGGTVLEAERRNAENERRLIEQRDSDGHDVKG